MNEISIDHQATAIRPGMAVVAKDGFAGTINELVADANSGEVTHFVMHGGQRWARKQLTLPITAVAQVVGDKVHLKLDTDAIGQLPAVPLPRQRVWAGEEQVKMDLAAVVFDAPEDAARALEFVEGLRRRGTLKIRNAAVLVADAEGNVTVKDTRDIDPKRGRLLGAVTGGVVGLVGGPIGAVVGALAGAGAGGLAGKKIDLGFSDQFLSGLKQYLQPNTSGLIVLVEHEYYHQLSEVIAEEEGVFFHQALTDRLVERLLAEGE